MQENLDQTPAQAAETLALQVITFILQDTGRWQKFTVETGVSQQQLTELINESGFLRAVLTYLLGDESLLLTFCAHHQVPPGEPARLLNCLE